MLKPCRGFKNAILKECLPYKPVRNALIKFLPRKCVGAKDPEDLTKVVQASGINPTLDRLEYVLIKVLLLHVSWMRVKVTDIVRSMDVIFSSWPPSPLHQEYTKALLREWGFGQEILVFWLFFWYQLVVVRLENLCFHRSGLTYALKSNCKFTPTDYPWLLWIFCMTFGISLIAVEIFFLKDVTNPESNRSYVLNRSIRLDSRATINYARWSTRRECSLY